MRTAPALILITCLATLVGDARAQSDLGPDSGPFVAVDVVGSPLVIGIEGKAFGATAGYRFSRSGELALRVERAPAEEDPLFDIAGKTFVGAGAALGYGPDRAPVQFALVAGAAVEDRSGLAVFPGGGSEFRGGRRIYQLNAAASAVKYFPLSSGTVRISAGLGPFVEVRHILPRTTTFNAGSPDEVVIDDGPITEWPLGVVLAAPITVRVGGDVDLVIEPSVRLDLATSLLGGGGYPHISVGLDL